MDIYISHLIENNQFLELLEQYPVGIEIIHFGISSVLDDVQNELQNYKAQLGEALTSRNLSLHGPFFDMAPASFDSRIKAITMERFETTYQMAKALDAKKVVYHTCFIPITYYIEGWLDNSIGFWTEFMANKDTSIEVHLENVYEEEYWPMVKVIDTVNHPAFTACLDIGHVHAYSSKSISEWIHGLGSRIGHVHIHNNDGTKDAHCALEQGSLDMVDTLELVHQTVPDASWTLELSHIDKLIPSLEWLKNRGYL